MTANKVTKLAQIQAPRITKLTLDENEIAECDLKSHPALRVLSLNKNKLTSCKGVSGLSELEELSLQENETLITLEGLGQLPKMKSLNLTGSKVADLNHIPDLPCLEQLILTGNDIKSLDELPKLKTLKKLSDLSLDGTPLAEEKGEDLKKEILISLMDDLPMLKKINGDGWDAEFLAEVKNEKAERIKAAEEARKEAEAAAAAAAANPEAAEGEPKEDGE